jgi:hypothetical protein
MPEHSSRHHRNPALEHIELQPRDRAVLRDLYYFRFASTPALMRTAAWASGGAGMQHFAKRLSALWRAGYVSRFDAGTSRYLHGSRPMLYTIESGKAAGAARTGRRPDDISEDAWRDILREATPVRTRIREALLACGFDLAEIDRVLHNNCELGLKHYVGDPSGVRHHVLAAECLSALWYYARMAGHAVEDVKPDGIADLSFPEPEPHRYRELVNREGMVVIKPDCVFTIAGQRYALEAEMGTTNPKNIALKVRRYARLMTTRGGHRLILHCHVRAHAEMILEAVRSIGPSHEVIVTISEQSTLVRLPTGSPLTSFPFCA